MIGMWHLSPSGKLSVQEEQCCPIYGIVKSILGSKLSSSLTACIFLNICAISAQHML